MLELIRIRHYIKNLLVFVALGCSGQFFYEDKAISCFIGFIAFCFLSSFIYIINDINDMEKDRNHPEKKNRPLPSGRVSKKQAILLAGLMLVCCIAANALIFSWSGTALLALYAAINICYSLGLKNYPIIDITLLVSGFAIRVFYGAVITDIVVSKWLYLAVITLSFYLVLGKRRNELRTLPEKGTRDVLACYTESFLNNNMYICMGLANVFYAFWAMDKSAQLGSEIIMFSVPVALLVCMKYSLTVEGENSGNPVDVLLKDKILIGLVAIFAGFVIYAIY